MDEDENRALTDIELSDIGQTLIALGEQLREIGNAAYQPTTRKELEQYYFGGGHSDPTEDVIEGDLAHAAARERMTRTLTGLNAFRRTYSQWERLSVEYALDRLGFTQRRTATLLGVGLSTVNRWAQHPLSADADED